MAKPTETVQGARSGGAITPSMARRDEFELDEGLHFTWTATGLTLTEAGADVIRAAGWDGQVIVRVIASRDGARISVKVLPDDTVIPGHLFPESGRVH